MKRLCLLFGLLLTGCPGLRLLGLVSLAVFGTGCPVPSQTLGQTCDPGAFDHCVEGLQCICTDPSNEFGGCTCRLLCPEGQCPSGCTCEPDPQGGPSRYCKKSDSSSNC
jgi:hypothetical protein